LTKLKSPATEPEFVKEEGAEPTPNPATLTSIRMAAGASETPMRKVPAVLREVDNFIIIVG
jgi:hypothetical protein